MESHSAGRSKSDAALALVILALGILLAVTGAALIERWQRSSARQQSVQWEDLLGLVASTSGLAIIAWWSWSLVAALVCAVLERTGNTRAAEFAGRLSPAFMRRLALMAVGLQLLGTPLANAAAGPEEDPGRQPVTAAVSASWTPTAAEQPCGTATPQWHPTAPVVDPGPLVAGPVRSVRQPPGTDAGEVTVVTGDSLWVIAARAIGPTASDIETALLWPRWYEANRGVIGERPDVLLPGQVLKPPPGA
jgi:LysM domain